MEGGHRGLRGARAGTLSVDRQGRFYRIERVGRGSKTLFVALVVIALALGLAACGGGDDSGSTGATASEQSGGSASSGGGDRSTSGDENRGESSGGRESDESRSEEAAGFKPKQHDDTGGGSAQFKVNGGDNSIQDFGEEADAPEFEAAASALHDFLDARAEGNWAAACDYMSKAIVESFEKLAAKAGQLDDKSCGGVLEQLTNPAAKQALKAEAEAADVGSLRTDGARSFVIYTGAERTVLAMPMANEGGAWKVASLAGTPLD